MELEGPDTDVSAMEQELSRAIIEATVDECQLRQRPHPPRQVPLRRRGLGRLPAVLQPVSVGTKSLADYTHLAGRPLIQEIRELAEPLQGLRVLHLSATAFGGGVAEILYTLIPLMNDVGIDAQWEVMLGREEFYNVTKRLHNALQGNPDSLSDEEWKIFERYNELNADRGVRRLGRDHRPRPAAGRGAPARAGQGADLDLALPHRPVHAQPGRDRPHRAVRARLRRVGLARARLRAGEPERRRRRA